MLERWLSGIERVHRADTPEEREAIYRFRYGVYVEELKRAIGGVDHRRRRVCDADDEMPWSTHLYVGTPDAVAGAVRIRVWEPGRVPPADADALSLDLFPNAAELRISEIGRFMIRPTMRGRLLLPALAHAGYDLLAGEKAADLAFCTCRPGLVGYYRRLGARPYGGRMVAAPEGLEVPLVSVLSDEATFRKMGSPMAPLVKRHFGQGKRPPVDPAPFAHLFREDVQSVETDPEAIWKELESRLLQPGEGPQTFFEALGEDVTRRLSGYGVVLSTPPGTLVTREGHAERELFVVFDGDYEVRAGGRKLARLGRGAVFGEVGFFRDTGVRSASVHAVTGGRVLVLSRKFLKELAGRDAEAAHAVLFQLGRLLAERLAQATAQA